MTGDSPSSARPDLRERIAQRFFGLVNPLARRMIPAGADGSSERPPGDTRAAVRFGAYDAVRGARHRWTLVCPGDLWSGRLGSKPSGSRRGDGNPLGWPSQSGSRHRDLTRGGGSHSSARARAVPPVAPPPQVAWPEHKTARRGSAPISDPRRRHPTGLPRRSSPPPTVRTPTCVATTTTSRHTGPPGPHVSNRADDPAPRRAIATNARYHARPVLRRGRSRRPARTR